MRNNLDRLDKKLTMKGQLEKLNYRRTDERLKGFTKLFYFKNPAEEDEGDDNIPKGNAINEYLINEGLELLNADQNRANDRPKKIFFRNEKAA